MKNKLLLYFLLSLSFFAISAKPIYADEKEKSRDLDVELIFSNNQDTKTTSYFKINWVPGSTEEIGLNLTNNTNEEKSFKIKVNKAETNMNGGISYDYSNDETTPKLTNPDIDGQLSLPKKITLKPNERKTIKGSFSIPNNDFQGFKLAGLVISEDKEKNRQQGTMSQTMGYAFPIVLKGNLEGRPNHKISFGEFGFKKIGSKQYSIETPFSNENYNWIPEVNAKVTIETKDNELLFENEKIIEMTPETTVNYSPIFNDEFSSGDYKVTLTLKSGTGEWSDTQIVNVSKAQEKEMKENKNTIIVKDNSKIIIIISVVISIILIAFITIIVILSKKNKGN